MWPLLELGPLDATHRAAVQLHMLSLSADDRYRRFGTLASDRSLINWVAQHMDGDQLWWGAWLPDLGLIGVAQLAPMHRPDMRELGMSVHAAMRCRGVATALVTMALQSRWATQACAVVCQQGHPAVLRMVRRLGHTVHQHGDACPVFIHLGQENCFE